MTDAMFSGAVREAATRPSHAAAASPNKPRPVDPLLIAVADTLRRIEVNYDREGSGPGSRFEGQLLEDVQARTVVAMTRAWLAEQAPPEGIQDGPEAAQDGPGVMPEGESAAVPATGYLTPAQAAAVLGVPARNLRYLGEEGGLVTRRTPGGTRRYLAASARALRAEMDAAGEALSYTEVARMFNVSTVTVSRWVAAGRLVPVRVPGKRRRGIRPQDVRALLRGEEPEVARKLGIEQRDRIAGEAHGG